MNSSSSSSAAKAPCCSGGAVPKFADFGKTASDLLSKDFPAGIVRVEGKAISFPNKTFTFTACKNVDSGMLTQEVKHVCTHAVRREVLGVEPVFVSTTTLTSANALTEQLELKNALGKGVHLEATGTLSQLSAPTAKLGFTVAKKCVQMNSVFELCNKSAPLVSSNLSFRAYKDLMLGAEGTFDVGRSKMDKYAMGATWCMSNYKLSLCAHTGFNLMTASFFQHIAEKGVSLAYKVGWNRKVPASSLSMEVAAKFEMGGDKGAWIKAKLENTGRLALAYSSAVGADVRMTIGAAMDATKMTDAATHKLGLSLVFGD